MNDAHRDPVHELINTNRKISKESLKQNQRDRTSHRRRRNRIVTAAAIGAVLIAVLGTLYLIPGAGDEPIAGVAASGENTTPEPPDPPSGTQTPRASDTGAVDGSETNTETVGEAASSEQPRVDETQRDPAAPPSEPDESAASERQTVAEGQNRAAAPPAEADGAAPSERPTVENSEARRETRTTDERSAPAETSPADTRVTRNGGTRTGEATVTGAERRERSNAAGLDRSEPAVVARAQNPPARGADPVAQEVATELIPIPGGAFEFGAVPTDLASSENEGPRATVEVAGFLLERHEVTNRQYQRFLEATGYPRLPISDDPSFQAYSWNSETGTFPAGTGDLPVVNVSRTDAEAYARWVGRRLPTEIEWEYAARAGSAEATYPWGNSQALRFQANFDAERLLPVESYQPNDFGVYDMGGNAFEWLATPYIADIHERLQDGASPADLRGTEAQFGVLRGGAFYSTFREVRWAYREFNLPSVRYPGYGFRLAADR